MLEVEHLRFSFGAREVLRGVDLRAEPGELVFVLGANGAGKTTLFRCILGLLPGYQGCVRVDGCDVSSLAPRALAKKIAYIPQTSHMIFPYTALELVLMGTNRRLGLFSAPGRRERAIAMEALEELGIADYAHRSFAELSGGEQQLVLAARALAQQARLLLMDEPTSALDFGNQVRVLERVSALTLRGYTVLLSCHNPQHAMLYAQRVVALHDGLVAADGPPDQALDEALMRKLYGVPARFVRTGDGVLIAPVRKSIVLWTPDMVRFMADAIRVNGSCAAMAAALSQVLPPGARVCDAGCGLGGLSLALAPYCRAVVAADLSAEAIRHLEAQPLPPNVEPRRCDVLADTPDEPYDAMVFCFFGRTDEILSAARRQCTGTVAVLKRCGRDHRFSRGKDHPRQGFEELCRELEEKGIPYQSRVLELDMGQPFRSPDPAPAVSTPAQPEDGSASFTDSVGRTVEVPAEITSVAVSGPLAQMVLFALCPDKLVGIADEWDASAEQYLATEYYNLPLLGQLYGGKGELNLETLLGSGAQVVIDVGEPKDTIVEDLDALQEQTGIPFVHVSATIETMGDAYRKLGELLGMEEAETLATYCDETYAMVKDVAEHVEKANLLYITGDAGLNVIAQGSYHAEIIDLLSNNLAVVDSPSSKGTGNEVDMEQLMLWNPDVILFAPDSVYASVGDDPLWQSLTAIQNGSYYEAPMGPYNWMGFPPSVQRYLGMLWMAKLLYPDAADYDLQAEVTEYFDLFYHCALTGEQYEALMANSIGKQ